MTTLAKLLEQKKEMIDRLQDDPVRKSGSKSNNCWRRSIGHWTCSRGRG